MSLELVREVSRENPDLLPTNLGRTCYRHTLLLVEKLRARGHDAFLVCKSPGEGQYHPPGFTTRTVTGHDGKAYLCSGVSHDAIYCDGKQFDTLGSANEYDRPIYRRNGDPNWSFDPADGPQIVASPVWSEIPRDKWRNNNPPLRTPGPLPVTAPPLPTPSPAQPPAVTMPSYEDLGGDAYWRSAIGVPLQEDMTKATSEHGGGPLNDGSSVWFSRPIFLILHAYASGQTPDRAAIIKKVRNEWRAVLTQQGAQGLPPL